MSHVFEIEMSEFALIDCLTYYLTFFSVKFIIEYPQIEDLTIHFL